MKMEKGTIIEKGNVKYIVLDCLDYEEDHFIFVNELNSDLSSGDSYFILKVLPDDVEFEYRNHIVDSLLPEFYRNLSMNVEGDF